MADVAPGFVVDDPLCSDDLDTGFGRPGGIDSKLATDNSISDVKPYKLDLENLIFPVFLCVRGRQVLGRDSKPGFHPPPPRQVSPHSPPDPER